MIIKILSLTAQRNRQGLDLANYLYENGFEITLYQWSSDHNHKPFAFKAIHLPHISPKVRFIYNLPFIKGLVLRILFFINALKGGCDFLIAINYEALAITSILSKILGAKVIYYPLEYLKNKRARVREGKLCSRHCHAIIDVEENRLLLRKNYTQKSINSFILHNMPRKDIILPEKGRLRKYLRQNSRYFSNNVIVLLQGSYQKYSRMEDIIRWAYNWRPELRLVLMITDQIPESITSLVEQRPDKIILVPPVAHDELYNWIVDADIGLLPYESEDDLNVKYCSPQKIFDYLACGVPILGSQKPIIAKIIEEKNVGICISPFNEECFTRGVYTLAFNKNLLKDYSINARNAYESTYNYDNFASNIVNSIMTS